LQYFSPGELAAGLHRRLQHCLHDTMPRHSVKYRVTNLVVMPGHVHLLVVLRDDDSLLKQFENWKRYSARILNKQISSRGRFWQQDGFDHPVRSPSRCVQFRDSSAANPGKAGLRSEESLHYAADVKGKASLGQ
jgi:REP element-mobilizing transposase RayT